MRMTWIGGGLALATVFCGVILWNLAGERSPTTGSGSDANTSSGNLASTPAQLVSIHQPFGLFFRGDTDVFEAPVLKTQVDLAVHGLIVRATVRQHFANPSNAWLEGIYRFPLPERSAVDRLRMLVGDRVIEGEIHERAQAQRIYDQAKQEGKLAGLVSSARENIFTTSVANVGPGDKVIIEIQYEDTVLSHDGEYSLRFPMVVAPRYMPGDLTLAPNGKIGTTAVPDAENLLTPIRHPAEGAINPVSLAIHLHAGFPLDAVTSLYHPVDIMPTAPDSREITLADGATPANRDFVLTWKPAPATEPAMSLFAEDKGDHIFVYGTVFPPYHTASAPDSPPRDLLLLVDISGSMAGTSLAQVQDALDQVFSQLTPDDRFNLITFANDTNQMFDTVRPGTPANIEAARKFVEGLDADGGTELLPALQTALQTPTDPDRLAQIILLTDGAIGNEAQVFEAIHRELGSKRLFTIGIGSAPNSHFMREAAESGRGTFTYIGHVDETKDRMLAVFQKLAHPAVTDLALRWPALEHETDAHRAEVYPSLLPDLYMGEPVTFTAKVPKDLFDRSHEPLILTGNLGLQRWEKEFTLDRITTAEGISKLWARQKIANVLSEERKGLLASDVARQEVIALALQHHLVTQYTSLVAVEQIVSRPVGEPLATRHLASNLPAGWNFEKMLPGRGTPVMPHHRPAPEQIMATVNPATLVALALPQSATTAPLHLLIGASLLFVCGLVAMTLRGRRC